MTGKELEQIYNEAYKAVYWTAMSLLKNEADAEDIVQDTFVSFIESYSDLKDTSKATALLKKIAANKCLDRIKLAKTDSVEDEFFDNVEAVPEDFLPDTIIESAEMRKIVMDIIEKSLSEDVRRTLILFYFDEMSTKEIAEALGIPQGTVLRRLNDARKKIKKEVEKYEDENDTKLFGMAIPFLSKLFIKESEQVVFKPMPASLSNLSASAEAPIEGAGIKASAEAVTKGADNMKTKILIGCIAAAVAVSVTVGIIAGVVSKTGRSKGGENASSVAGEIERNRNDDEDNGHGGEDYTEPEETEASSRTTKAAGSDSIIVDMTGMTAAEIVNNINKMRKFSEGTKDSSITDRFYYDEEQTPLRYNESNPFYWTFSKWDNDKTDAYLMTMCVSSFGSKGNTYYYHEEAYTDVTFMIKDEKFAKEVFQAIVDWLSSEYEKKEDVNASNGKRIVEFSTGKYTFTMSYMSYIGEYAIHIQLPIKP